MAGLSDALANAAVNARMGGARCTVAVILDDLDDGDRASLVEALANRKLSVNVIYRALTETTGEKPSRSGIERHRRGDCACPT